MARKAMRAAKPLGLIALGWVLASLYILGPRIAVNRGLDVPLADGLAVEADLFGTIASTSDMKEGTAAFLAKRPPNFSGK